MKWESKRLKTLDRDSNLLKSLLHEDSRSLAIGSWVSVLAALTSVAELSAIALAVSNTFETSSLVSSVPYLGAFVLLAFLRISIEAAGTLLIARAAEQVKARARDDIAAAIGDISPYDKSRPHAGELAALISSHVDALGPYLTRYQPAQLRTSVVPIIILAITACFSWIAAIVLLITGPLIPIFMALIGGKAREASESQLQEIGTMNGALLDRLQGLTTLHLFDAVPRATHELLGSGQKIREKTMAVLRIAFLSSAVLELFAALGVAFAAVYVGFNLLGQFSFGAYGELTLFGGLFVLMIAPEYFRPLREFAAAYHERAAALAASREIGKILRNNWLRLPQQKRSDVSSGSIFAHDVSLEIANKSVISEFSLHIDQGEQVALVGPSGCGKSILLALLGRLVTPTRGTVQTNGKIAWLGQKPAFLQGSLTSNLTLYGPHAKQHLIAHAVDLAQANEIVAKLDRGYGEILRDNAINLSGGEAQRIALARLALSDAPIILADEPTEHLDDETANAVIEGLFKSASGRTLLIATHDRRVIARTSRVINVRDLQKTDPLEVAA